MAGGQRTRRGVEALVETVGVLAGAPLVASTLEADVLPARVAGYRASMLDELCTPATSCGWAPGRSGRTTGACGCASPTRSPCWRRAGSGQDPPPGPSTTPCASCSPAAAPASGRSCGPAPSGPTDAELLAALWDLVWAGEVTNDSLAALRAMTTGSGATARPGGGGTASRGRGRPSRLGRIGPAAGAGRWSLVAPLLEPRPTDTASAHATAMQLVERHGVVTREAVLAEGVVGGFASVYGVLKVLEDRGQVRRGYFVSGLGAAQFALPGAVDRLRRSAARTIRPSRSSG